MSERLEQMWIAFAVCMVCVALLNLMSVMHWYRGFVCVMGVWCAVVLYWLWNLIQWIRERRKRK